jgi:N-methylhydantoinase A
MGGAIRLISIERGYDPKLFAMMPFGGGGALHAGALMLDIGLGASVVPRYPGVNSALGCVMSDLRHDEVRTMNVLLDELDCAELAQMIKEITLSSTKRVQNTKAKLASIDRIIELDMLYMGQSHSVAVPILEDPEKLTVATIGAAFDRAYAKAYSRPLTGIPIRILNLRLSMVGVRPAIDLQILTKGARADSVASCLISEQPIYADGSWHNGQIIDRLRLPEGAELHGPALLVQPDATIYLDPFIIATVDSLGNIIMKTRG